MQIEAQFTEPVASWIATLAAEAGISHSEVVERALAWMHAVDPSTGAEEPEWPPHRPQ